jgi:hypothetical protein
MVGERKRRHFLILFQGRAGSSYLIDALGRLPDVVAEGEMLVDPDPTGGTFAGRLRRLLRPEAAIEPARFQLETTRRFFTAAWPGSDAVGFKTKARDVFDLEGFGAILDEHAVRVIVLERQNLVKQAVSHLNARRLHEVRGEWNLTGGQPTLGPFEIDPEQFDGMLAQVTFEQHMLDAFARYIRTPVLRLEYDDLLRDRAAWFGAACGFLGRPAVEPESGVRKNTRDDLREVLLNFDVLRARYARTRFAAMFDGPAR